MKFRLHRSFVLDKRLLSNLNAFLVPETSYLQYSGDTLFQLKSTYKSTCTYVNLRSKIANLQLTRKFTQKGQLTANLNLRELTLQKSQLTT